MDGLLSSALVNQCAPHRTRQHALCFVIITTLLHVMQGEQEDDIVLVIGSCGLDRLLTVPSYPKPDAKIRTTAYHEVGGGNAANTASAMALLSNALFFGKQKIRVKLLTKIGDDHIGHQLSEELRQAGVDLSSPLFKKGDCGTSTSLTSVVVSEKEHTRTCIHTPGTCGELTASDVSSVDSDDLFTGVVHLHSDARHTEASFVLAQEACNRGIPVSVDAEKDRGTFMDKLLELSTIVFTNSQQLDDYIVRRTLQLEKQLARQPLPEPNIVVDGEGPPDAKVNIYANSILPSSYFLRWYEPSKSNKEVVITQ